MANSYFYRHHRQPRLDAMLSTSLFLYKMRVKWLWFEIILFSNNNKNNIFVTKYERVLDNYNRYWILLFSNTSKAEIFSAAPVYNSSLSFNHVWHVAAISCNLSLCPVTLTSFLHCDCSILDHLLSADGDLAQFCDVSYKIINK